MRKVCYVDSGALGYFDGEKQNRFESDQIADYIENCSQIARSHEWKNSGSSAMFQGRQNESNIGKVCISGISFYSEGKLLYASVTGGVSSILIKDIETGCENYLLHENSKEFSDIAFYPGANKVLMSMAQSHFSSNIGIYNADTNVLSLLTDGDTMDVVPFLCKNGRVLYTSIANGRNLQGDIVGRDCAVLCSIQSRLIEEQKRLNGLDILMPKQDAFGNLYYIQKPYKEKKNKTSNAFLDLILMPFRLIYGLIKGLIFLSKLSVKKKSKEDSFVSSGDNPALSNQKDGKLELYGYTIDINESEKRKKGKSTQSNEDEGFAPSSWALYKCSSEGETQKLAEKVLSYDLDANTGEIVFTNGKTAYLLLPEQKPQKLFRSKLITHIALEKQSEQYNQDPFL